LPVLGGWEMVQERQRDLFRFDGPLPSQQHSTVVQYSAVQLRTAQYSTVM